MHKRFLQLCKEGHLKAETFSFIETSFTFMTFLYLKIVAYDSAGMYIIKLIDFYNAEMLLNKVTNNDLHLEVTNIILSLAL